MIAGAAAIVMLTVAVAVPLVAPVAVTVKLAVVCVAVGVPLMTPVVLLKLRPVGKVGLMA